MANINIPAEVFANYVVEKLRRTNPHVSLASDESQYVKAGAVVHIPQAGASPKVEKNRSTFPAVATRRGDTSVTYALDSFTTEPVHVAWSEAAELSYNKTDSVLSDHVATLMEAVGDNIIYDWTAGLKNGANDTIPASNIVECSGAQEEIEIGAGVTVTRNAFTYKELEKAQYLMNHQNSGSERQQVTIDYIEQLTGFEFFANVPSILRKIETLKQVGLGYIRLGQPSTTLFMNALSLVSR